MSRARAAAASVAAVAVVAMVMPSTAGPAGRGPVPGTTCEVFPVDNVWRMDVSAQAEASEEPDLEAFEPRGVDRPAS